MLNSDIWEWVLLLCATDSPDLDYYSSTNLYGLYNDWYRKAVLVGAMSELFQFALGTFVWQASLQI